MVVFAVRLEYFFWRSEGGEGERGGGERSVVVGRR